MTTTTYRRPEDLDWDTIDPAAPAADHDPSGAICGAEFEVLWTCTRRPHHTDAEHRAAFENGGDGPESTVGYAWTAPDTPHEPTLPLGLATSRFVSVFTVEDLAEAVGPHLQCDEAEVLADLLRALGQPEAASLWMHTHAVTDGEDGVHDASTGRRKA
jgi:hypothetical protein